MEFTRELERLLQSHREVRSNPSRGRLIEEAVERREALVSQSGALATWTPPESTGRSPKDTVIVRHEASAGEIDWTSPNNLPLDEETFAMILEDALEALRAKPRLYLTERVVGADSSYALPVRTITDRALTALFTDNMFRPVPPDLGRSTFAGRPLTILALPYDKLDPERYKGRLRTDPATGKASRMVIAMDFDRLIGVVFGSAYCGSVKKLVFTVMNYLLPPEGILPLHCAANEGPQGDVALFLGLSGTGKTSLSADPERALLGDDEHGWGPNGVANFESGCYAKLIDLDPNKEPEIYNAIMHKAHYLEHGAIVENAMIYPDGEFDFHDSRLTPNSRGSYPLTFLKNIKPSAQGGHPRTILFLTADANGVLPPIARLTKDQAMLWFLMGYTSKLAGTETGVIEPQSTFSRFFGEPFMPRKPEVYARMLGEKLEEHGTRVYLVNTGWSGGPYGIGRRLDIRLTRAMVRAALNGALEETDYEEDKLFHLWVPQSCPGVPSEILNRRNTWQDKGEYDRRAAKLAAEFAAHFDRAYGDKGLDPRIRVQCPGK
ncbi:MAG: phosphoenolpyruvate carboxykinase (ATP) [Candidatus Acetothermia bacterium]|jgi:phosphoenolpyruvate carboxykinase (ATP)|nr:phosphoenolpyruvate carboxykinase (ATP) [Candidatus Acetothermia bacterium]MDH7505293.1 phosphoenolpyruvate carboxykinase (ATP) [Candidatus Acetothermia bacterium]